MRYKIQGLMCAIGCFIADSEYKRDFEGVGAWRLLAEVGLGDAIPRTQLKLLVKLQQCHDDVLVHNWKTRLQEIADLFKLSTKVLC